MTKELPLFFLQRSNKRSDKPDRAEKPHAQRGVRKGRRKVCSFCVDKIDKIDYKDVARLRRCMSERAKYSTPVTGNCAAHQRKMTELNARHIALLPFESDTILNRPPKVYWRERFFFSLVCHINANIN